MKKIRFTIKEVVYQLIYCTTFFLHPYYICIQSHIHIFTDVKRLSARLELSLPGNLSNSAEVSKQLAVVILIINL